jgi:subtilisin family serine protease
VADHGAKVVNISLSGGGVPTTEEVGAVDYALSKDVVVVVASAGNVAQTGVAVGSPASIPGVVAVSGIQETPAEKVLIIGIPIILIVGVVILIVRASAKARARARPGGPNSNNVRW